LYNKEKLLANGDMAEAEIAANLQADHVSSLLIGSRKKLTFAVLPLSLRSHDWTGVGGGVRRRSCSQVPILTAYALIFYRFLSPAPAVLHNVMVCSV
jgi:hypothetical protein